MTPNEAREIIYQHLVDNWAPPSPVVPYVFEGESYDSQGKVEYIEVNVRNTEGGQHTLGSPGERVFRRRGLVLIQVFVPADRGLLRLDVLGKAALDLFEGETISQVMFHDGQYRERSEESRSDGTWKRGSVTVSFTYDETK